MKKITIAIDGHSSCGKSTMAKDLAREVGYVYVDTGAMYRAVTLYGLRNGMIDKATHHVDTKQLIQHLDNIHITFQRDDAQRLHTMLNDQNVERDIRGMDVAACVSHVAAIPEVRAALVRQQQRMGEQKGIVMDGRDIGTVVFPNAELKVFVTASAEVRAQRRYDELIAKGAKADYQDILANVMERDRIDTTRETSPLRKADDALTLDNSNMTPDEQLQWLIEKVQQRLS